MCVCACVCVYGVRIFSFLKLCQPCVAVVSDYSIMGKILFYCAQSNLIVAFDVIAPGSRLVAKQFQSFIVVSDC